MRFEEKSKAYLDLLEKFLAGTLAIDEFCDEFMTTWRAYRDAILDKSKNWDKPYHLQLSDALKNGDITEQEFDKEWRALWGFEGKEEMQLDDISSKLFAAIDAYTDDAELLNDDAWRIDAQKLRSIAAASMTEILELTKTVDKKVIALEK